jgi:AcrR family transcriptional regulator
LTTAAAVARSRPRGETRRAQILDGATAVFLEYGYAGATIELVVARIGASKATIYSFFGGKEGLFSALIEERTEHVLAGFKDIEIGTVNVHRDLAQFAQQYMDVVMSPDAIELYRLILAEGPRFPDLVKSFYRIGPDRVTARVAKELRLWAERGRINTDDPERIAAQFLDTVRGELHLRVMAGLPPDNLAIAIKSNIDHAVRTFWRAIRPKSALEA